MLISYILLLIIKITISSILTGSKNYNLTTITFKVVVSCERACAFVFLCVNCPKTFHLHCTFCKDLIFIPIMKFSASILLNYYIILYKFNHVIGSG